MNSFTTWILHLGSNHNHEIWRKCPRCGAYNDLRMTEHCEACKLPLLVHED